MMTETAELLIVEDNPNDLELTLRALQRTAFTGPIHVAKDGAEALDYLKARGRFANQTSGQTLKAIFLDLKLPKIDGMEVLRQLKSDAKTRQIPVVMLTSSQQERDVLESYRLGVNSYIVKPVDFTQFSEAIGRLADYWLRLNLPHR